MGNIARRARVGNPLPFGAVPHEIVTDPRLEPRTDCAVVARLLFHARWDDQADVSDGMIAKALDVSRWTVQRSLKRLEEAGWIRRRQAPKTGQNQTGRIIMLCWKLPDFGMSRSGNPGDRMRGEAVAPVLQGVLHGRHRGSSTGATQQRVVVVEGEENKTPLTPHPNDNDPDPGPAVILLADPECEARVLVEDLCGSLADPVDRVRPVDADTEAARPVPHVYPMATVVTPPAPVPPPRLKDSSVTPAEASTPTPEGLTPGQVAFLAALPPEKRATFDGLSPGRKAEVLARRRDGELTDPLLLKMEAADLAPRRDVAAPRPVLTIEDAVEAIVGGYRPATAMLATMLAREFADQKSWPFFDQIGGLIFRDPACAGDFLDALRQARNPKAKNPGAVLVTALKRDYGW